MANLKSNIPRLLFIALVFGISSCSLKSKFEYDEHKSEYLQAINCLQQNSSVIFATMTLGNAVSLYQKNFQHLKICENVLQLMKKYSIEFAVCYKDSMIAFFKNAVKGIEEKQFILIFSNNQEKINDKLTSDIKVIKKDKECYELERIISLTN